MTKTEAKECAQDLIMTSTESAYQMIESHGVKRGRDAELVDEAMRKQMKRVAKLFGWTTYEGEII